LFKSFYLVFGSNFFSACLGFIISIIVGNILSIEDYGRFYFLTTAFYILTFLIDGGLSTSIPVFLSKYGDYNVSTILEQILKLKRQNLILTFMALISSGLILILRGEVDFLIFFFVIVGSIIGSASKVLNSILQGKNQWKSFSIITITLNLFRIILLLFVISFQVFKNLEVILVIFILSLICQFLILLQILKKVRDKEGKNIAIEISAKRFLNEHYKAFFIITVLTVFASRMDIVLGNFISTKEEIGIYSMASNLAFIFPIITTSTLQILITRKDNILNILSKSILFKILILLLVLVFINISISPFAIEWIFRGKYNQALNSFILLSTIHIVGVFFTPLESNLIKDSPKQVLNLKIIQFLILAATPFLLKSWGINALVMSVFISRFYAWQFLIRINYDQIRKKFFA